MPANFLKSHLLNPRISDSTVHTVEVVNGFRIKADGGGTSGERGQFIGRIEQINSSTAPKEVILGHPFHWPVGTIICYFFTGFVMQGQYPGIKTILKLLSIADVDIVVQRNPVSSPFIIHNAII